MLDQDRKKKIVQKLTIARQQLLMQYPFYGLLLMRMKFGLADCETAFTDMQKIVFDPLFVERLSIEELEFIMQHEVLHCVLNHCTRGKGLNRFVYNVACDIVVNSNILSYAQMLEFKVDGKEVMHLAPDGKEGCLYTAEKVYHMLMEEGMTDKEMIFSGNPDMGECDRHDLWDEIEHTVILENEWKVHIESVCRNMGGTEQIPEHIRDFLDSMNYKSRLDWRDILRDFLRLHADDFDYTYKMPDRRYLYMDVVYPGFYEVMNEEMDGIYFFVDTSASIDMKMIGEVFGEIRAALEQVDGLKGWLSFFDTRVYGTERIDGIKSLENIRPVGGGGTDFYSIFRHLEKVEKEKKIKAVIVLTDGYAYYPDEKAAMDIPVLWIIGHSNIKPPWGRYVKYSRE